MDALQSMLTAIDLERGLLAAFADNPDLLWQWSDRIPSGVFSDPALGAIYESQQVAVASNRPLPRPDGEVSIPDDPDGAAEELLSLYQKRRLTSLCQAVLQKVRDVPDPAELLSALTADLADLELERGRILASAVTPAKDLLPFLWDDLDRRKKAAEETGLPGIPTGFRHLDNLTAGLEPGLYLLAGPPKSGKTTLANQIAYNVAVIGIPVVYVSFENDPLDLTLKQLCRLSGQPLLRAQKGKADLSELERAAKRFESRAGACLYYIAGGAETTVPRVRAAMKQVLVRHGTKRGLLVLDYLQKMALVKQSGEMRDCVNRLSLQLRDLAREINSPLLALSSVSRGGDGYKKLSLDRLKESGNLEFDCDGAWFLEPGDKVRPGLKKMSLVVAAARRSPTGNIEMALQEDCGRFAELEDEPCGTPKSS